HERQDFIDVSPGTAPDRRARGGQEEISAGTTASELRRARPPIRAAGRLQEPNAHRGRVACGRAVRARPRATYLRCGGSRQLLDGRPSFRRPTARCTARLRSAPEQRFQVALDLDDAIDERMT